jgi:O-antigen ligase
MLAKYFFSISLLLVGGVSIVLPSGYSLGFYSVCFVSFAVWIKVRSDLLPSDVKWFIFPLLFYAVGHGALALNEKWVLREFDNYLPFVLIVFGLWGIRNFKPKQIWFWIGLAIGAIGAAIFSGYQALVMDLRAGGFTNPIQFGNIALLMGVLCFVRALVGAHHGWVNLVLWTGFFAGLVASVWSQTRGGWLALAFIFIWILVNATKNWPLLKRRMMLAGFCLFLLVLTLQSKGIVQSRMAIATAEIKAYVETGKQDTSVGARLAMWTLAWSDVAKEPWLGHGDKGWIELRDSAIEDGRLSTFSSSFTHLHNEYMNVLFKRGLIGLVLYLGMFIVPMLLFFRPYLHHNDVEVRSLAMAGMVIPMMYMDFGLTQTFLSHNSGRIVLCSFWMCAAALMLNAVHDEKCKSEV